jgi:hypothetical protein
VSKQITVQESEECVVNEQDAQSRNWQAVSEDADTSIEEDDEDGDASLSEDEENGAVCDEEDGLKARVETIHKTLLEEGVESP